MAYEAILVPTDGSDHADRATTHALSLASTFGADVHALSVVDLARSAGPFDAGGIGADFLETLREEAEENVTRVENEWGQPDRFYGDVDEGPPAQTILNYVADHDIDLVVMGTHGRRGVARFVLGSVAEHVIRESPVPVLATRADEKSPTLPYRNVLVPTDGSDCATDALDHAMAIAEPSGARLHALHVVDDAVVMGAVDGELPSTYLDSLEQFGKQSLAEIEDRCAESGVDVQTTMERGRPSDVIDDYATDNDIDLVVMGTHGRSGLERVILGSTTERFLRRGHTPVLAVPERADEE